MYVVDVWLSKEGYLDLKRDRCPRDPCFSRGLRRIPSRGRPWCGGGWECTPGPAHSWTPSDGRQVWAPIVRNNRFKLSVPERMNSDKEQEVSKRHFMLAKVQAHPNNDVAGTKHKGGSALLTQEVGSSFLLAVGKRLTIYPDWLTQVARGDQKSYCWEGSRR